jgi:hypothetical protein
LRLAVYGVKGPLVEMLAAFFVGSGDGAVEAYSGELAGTDVIWGELSGRASIAIMAMKRSSEILFVISFFSNGLSKGNLRE